MTIGHWTANSLSKNIRMVIDGYRWSSLSQPSRPPRRPPPPLPLPPPRSPSGDRRLRLDDSVVVVELDSDESSSDSTVVLCDASTWCPMITIDINRKMTKILVFMVVLFESSSSSKLNQLCRWIVVFIWVLNVFLMTFHDSIGIELTLDTLVIKSSESRHQVTYSLKIGNDDQIGYKWRQKTTKHIQNRTLMVIFFNHV